MSPESKRPPLGLSPRWLHKKTRRYEILDALGRYYEADMKVPAEWLDELRELMCVAPDETRAKTAKVRVKGVKLNFDYPGMHTATLEFSEVAVADALMSHLHNNTAIEVEL